MPSVSDKTARLQASPIRKLAPHARAAEARGTNVIYLNIGQPDMPTPPEMIAELHGLSLATLAYAPSEGLPQAREAWSLQCAFQLRLYQSRTKFASQT